MKSIIQKTKIKPTWNKCFKYDKQKTKLTQNIPKITLHKNK